MLPEAKPFTCGSCIFFEDNELVCVCTAYNRWKKVKFDQECDIDSWSGFDLD